MEEVITSLKTERDSLLLERDQITTSLEAQIELHKLEVEKLKREVSPNNESQIQELNDLIISRDRQLASTRRELQQALVNVASLTDDLDDALSKPESTDKNVNTDDCEPSMFEKLQLRLADLDSECESLSCKFNEQRKDLERVQAENRALLQSNHKQKLQVCVLLYR